MVYVTRFSDFHMPEIGRFKGAAIPFVGGGMMAIAAMVIARISEEELFQRFAPVALCFFAVPLLTKALFPYLPFKVHNPRNVSSLKNIDRHLIVVTGVPGTGKSTVLDRVKGVRPDVNIVNFGTIMAEIMKEKNISRDAMRALPVSAQESLGLEAAKKIGAMPGTVILDTHGAINTPKGFIPGLPPAVASVLGPKTVVVLTSNPKDICQRRELDNSRARAVESEEEIKAHQKMTLNFLSQVVANMRGVTMKPIKNSAGRDGIKMAAAELIRLIPSAKGVGG